jgi:hypothetical protein
MKKSIAILLAIMLVLTLAACGGNNSRGVIEGSGYASPKAAVEAYLDALKIADIDLMMSTFAVETYAKNYDMAAFLRLYSFIIPRTDGSLPSNNEFTTTVNKYRRHGSIAFSIADQYMNLFLPDHEWTNLKTMRAIGEQEIETHMEAFDIPLYMDTLRSLQIIDFIPPASVDRNYETEATQMLIEQRAKICGADKIEGVIARVEIDRKTYLFCFETAAYGNKWYILNLGGIPAVSLGIPLNAGGIVLETVFDK